MALIKRNTTYQVGDVGYTIFGKKLICKTAGTTSSTPLVVTDNDIVDGTVTWYGGGASRESITI